MPSFSGQSSDLERDGPVIQASIAVADALEASLRAGGSAVPPPSPAAALIDTGASRTVVAPDVIRSLGILPIRFERVNVPGGALEAIPVYSVRVVLSPQLSLAVSALALDLTPQHIRCLIGRDVLREGIFVYNGVTNSFALAI